MFLFNKKDAVKIYTILMENQTLSEKPIAHGRTAEIYPWEEGRVLKLYFDWVRPNWVEEEAEATRAVHAAGLPVPWCGETLQINGRIGIVFERITGISMLKAFDQQPLKLFGLLTLLARLHVEMHQKSVPGLRDRHNSMRWSLQHAPLITDRQRGLLLSELDELPAGDRVCHSDFHPDNVMLTDRGPVIIDWMAGKKGNPMMDVARTSLLINNGAPVGKDVPRRRLLMVARRAGFWWYRQQYARLGNFDRQQYQRWMPIMAAARLNEQIPGEQDWLLNLVETGCASKE
jgi:Ser/Thr protein kinase RdoA (MazF antagonist)